MLSYKYGDLYDISGIFGKIDNPSRKSYSVGMNAVVSEKGQVTIPKAIRDDLGLQPGTVLDFIEDQGRIIVCKVVKENPFSAWRGKGRIPEGRSVDEYLALSREAR